MSEIFFLTLSLGPYFFWKECQLRAVTRSQTLPTPPLLYIFWPLWPYLSKRLSKPRFSDPFWAILGHFWAWEPTLHSKIRDNGFVKVFVDFLALNHIVCYWYIIYNIGYVAPFYHSGTTLKFGGVWDWNVSLILHCVLPNLNLPTTRLSFQYPTRTCPILNKPDLPVGPSAGFVKEEMKKG